MGGYASAKIQIIYHIFCIPYTVREMMRILDTMDGEATGS